MSDKNPQRRPPANTYTAWQRHGHFRAYIADTRH